MGYSMQWDRDNSEQGYYHANIWGMSTLRWLMHEAGALSDQDEMPKFPDWNQEWSKQDIDIDETPDERLTDDQRAYKHRCHEVRSMRSVEAGKVPWFKFASNDAWIVHADESRIIGQKLSALIAQMDSEGREVVVKDFMDNVTTINKNYEHLQYIRQFAEFNLMCAEMNATYMVT